MNNLLIVIPAIKKNAVIPDQLIKSLNGITLIQRAINTALKLTSNENIFIITDSDEISLISERNNIGYYKDSSLSFNSQNIIPSVQNIIKQKRHKYILLYRANTPLVDSIILNQAYKEFLKEDDCILTSVKNEQKKLLKLNNHYLTNIKENNYFKELKAFHIFNKLILNYEKQKPFVIDLEKSIEITNYQDWWVCEKVLQRKRIIFNVIGSLELGMGHIYHSLALAHEISDHEVIFVCNIKYKIAVDKIASTDYKVIPSKNPLDEILHLKPDLVINDILNTDEEYIKTLKENNIITVNFEDLGSGSKYADLVFNELYDEPQCEGENYRWGHKYMALRDEFYKAKPHQFIENVKSILITFGGTDQNNLTLLSLKAIIFQCKNKNIKIYIVCGNAYNFKNKLENYLEKIDYKNIELTYASGVISKIMEKTQLAISSNGRTIYELADMNIPSIIVCHHEREASHSFASLEKGFVNLGVINDSTKKNIQEKFKKLINDKDYRELLFMNIKKYNFRENKKKVIKLILDLL